jgi:hypothetical protein
MEPAGLILTPPFLGAPVTILHLASIMHDQVGVALHGKYNQAFWSAGLEREASPNVFFLL